MKIKIFLAPVLVMGIFCLQPFLCYNLVTEVEFFRWFKEVTIMASHVITLVKGVLVKSDRSAGCGECQTSCQSACKTSCTVGNQKCLNH
ncbi:MAG: hypothetical protein XD50_0615 [Clostridia bacterium 41_269]|nr:MAG: hypothetical protein XD50_0615 [Clostridia bacterium 41_269]